MHIWKNYTLRAEAKTTFQFQSNYLQKVEILNDRCCIHLEREPKLSIIIRIMTWIAPLAGRNTSTLAVSITQLPVYHLLTYSPQQQQQQDRRREEQPKCYFQYFHPLSSPPSPPDLGTCFVPPLLLVSIVINYINGTRHKL